MANLPLVRDKVQGIVNEQINNALKQVSFKNMLVKTWPQVNEPKQLEKDVWLLLQPEKIGLTVLLGLDVM